MPDARRETPPDLVTVRIVGLPVGLYRLASEHHDGLRRELALVHHGSSDDHSVPRRLEKLIEELNRSFGTFTDRPQAALRAAVERGDEHVDLDYQVPPEAKQATIDLDMLLDEADSFCREGAHLLTMATPPGPLAFRRWFLQEFAAQIDGAAPTPWVDWVTAPGADLSA